MANSYHFLVSLVGIELRNEYLNLEETTRTRYDNIVEYKYNHSQVPA